MNEVCMYIGNVIVWEGRQSSPAPSVGEWIRLGDKTYIVAHVCHIYSAASDTFTANVALAQLPDKWFIRHSPKKDNNF